MLKFWYKITILSLDKQGIYYFSLSCCCCSIALSFWGDKSSITSYFFPQKEWNKKEFLRTYPKKSSFHRMYDFFYLYGTVCFIHVGIVPDSTSRRYRLRLIKMENIEEQGDMYRFVTRRLMVKLEEVTWRLALSGGCERKSPWQTVRYALTHPWKPFDECVCLSRDFPVCLCTASSVLENSSVQ